jgi:tetratricopeptide (TPR) repeat protein
VPPIRSLIETNLIAGRFDSAAAAARRYIELRPADDYAYFTLAEVEGIRGDSDEALRSLGLAEQIGSGRGPGQLARAAEIYSRLGRTSDAMRLFSAMNSFTPSPSQAAVGNLAIGNLEESLRLFREASQSELALPGRILIILAKKNAWNDPALELPEFVEVRRRLGFRE